MALRIRTSRQWGIRPHDPWRRLGRVGRNVMHHSVTLATPDPDLDARTLDLIAHARGHNGISYNDLYHPPSRTIVEGRGGHVAAHGFGINSVSRGLCVIGDFRYSRLDATDKAIIREFLGLEVLLGALADGFVLESHSDSYATECPSSVRDSVRKGELYPRQGGKPADPSKPPKMPADVNWRVIVAATTAKSLRAIPGDAILGRRLPVTGVISRSWAVIDWQRALNLTMSAGLLESGVFDRATERRTLDYQHVLRYLGDDVPQHGLADRPTRDAMQLSLRTVR